MLVPLIFIITMVVRATHSLKAELVNGTATITIEDLDKACENSRSMRSGERKKGGETYAIALENPSLDTESLIRSVFEQLCPYVGYYPVKETAEKETPITVKDTSESKYHVEDETTRTTLLDKYSSSSTTEKSIEVLVNNSFEITSTTEYITKTTNKSEEMIADIKIDSHTYHNVTESTLKTEIETTMSTPKYKNDSTVYARPEKVLVNTSTTEHITEKSINSKNYSEITETTSVLSYSKATEYNSSFKETVKDLVLVNEMNNVTTSSTAVPITETTETTTIGTILKHDELLEGVINSTIVSTTTESLVPQVSSESTISIMTYKVKESPTKEHITYTTPIENNTSKSDIYEEKLSTEGSEIESTSTELPTTLFKDDIPLSTLLTSNSTDIVVTEENLESENITEATELFVHAYSSISYFSDDISGENTSYEVKNHNEHIDDELIIAVVVTESTSTTFDDDFDLLFNINETSIEEIPTVGVLHSSLFEEENLEVSENKLDGKIIYEHDLNAVDKRRYIVVIVFGTILLIFSLAWAIKVVINRHKESYELPQEENNDMELGDNTNGNPTK